MGRGFQGGKLSLERCVLAWGGGDSHCDRPRLHFGWGEALMGRKALLVEGVLFLKTEMAGGGSQDGERLTALLGAPKPSCLGEGS